MKSIDLSMIDLDNACFHFTNNKNFQSISELGLIAKIGKNAEGIEHSAKTFFAKGIKSALKIAEVWIRWFIYKAQFRRYTSKASSPQEYFEMNTKFRRDFLSGAIYTEDIKNECFGDFSNFMENNIYLILDLKEGEDYSLSDIDEVKKDWLDRGDKDVISAMYGGLTTINGNKYSMEPWNMHTKIGSTVGKEKIRFLKNQQATSALDILTAMYEKMKDKNLDLPLLESFFKYQHKKSAEIESAL